MAPNMLWFENSGARIDMKRRPNLHEELFVFLEVTFLVLVFFGQAWENPGKIPSHHQKFSCSYTYGLFKISDKNCTENCLYVTFVETSYFDTDMCKLESMQK